MTKLYFLVVVGLLCLVVANAWPQYRRGEQQPGSRTGEENGKEEPPSEDKSGKKCKVKDASGESANPEDKLTEEERVFDLLRQLYERGPESKNKKETGEASKKKKGGDRDKKKNDAERKPNQEPEHEPEHEPEYEPEHEPEHEPEPEPEHEPEHDPEPEQPEINDKRAVLESLRTLLRRRFRK